VTVKRAAEEAGCLVAVSVESRCLAIGDTLWMARRKQDKATFVLDYMVERKAVRHHLYAVSPS
jgi:hypothetical protein